MTQEQINHLDFSVNIQLNVLRDVMKQYHENKWTDTFSELVKETQRKLIWNLENFFLLPVYSFHPLERNFPEEDTTIRQEIAKKVENLFKNFKKEKKE